MTVIYTLLAIATFVALEAAHRRWRREGTPAARRWSEDHDRGTQGASARR